VVGIDCREMVEGLGTIHCISQQQPKIVLSSIRANVIV